MTVIHKTLFMVFISIALFVGAAMLLPAQVHVERSIDIQRPVSTVFSMVNGFESFAAWSPRLVRDPAMQYRVSGPDSGAGARLEWQGNPRQAGSGWQEITYSEPYRLVKADVQLDQQPLYRSYFHVEKVAGGSRLTWGLDTDLTDGQGVAGNIMARWFGLFFDRWVGTDFEKGLERLKIFAESLPAVDFAALEVDIVEVEPADVLYVPVGGNAQQSGVAGSMAEAFREITAFMVEQDLAMSAQPMAITRSWDEKGFRIDAAIPVVRSNVQPPGNVRWGHSPSGRAVRLIHRGPYDSMAPSYEKLAAYMAVHGLVEGNISWEQYISDPIETDPESLLTHIYFLVEESS